MKVNKVVKKETINMTIGIIICIAITQVGFLIFGMYGLPIILGSFYGGGITLLNFFLMGLTVQNVTLMEDEKAAKKKMQSSYSMRQLGVVLLIGVGMYISVNSGKMNWLAIVIPVVYPRIIILVVNIYRKKKVIERGDSEWM